MPGPRIATARNSKRNVFIAAILPWVTMVAAVGCDREMTPDNRTLAPHRMQALAALGPGGVAAVVAQGKLEPAGGVLPILVQPGDRIASVNVAEGDVVKSDQTLVVLASLAVRETELAIAETQLRESRTRAIAAAKVAQAKLDVATTQLAKAELEMQQAQARFDRAQASGGELDLLNQQVELNQNKLNQIRAAFNDASNQRLVSRASLDQQELAVSQAKSAAESARTDAQQAIQRERLSVETARRELEAAKLTVESSDAQSSFESLEQQIELLRLQVEATRVKSPVDAMVLRLSATAGQATTSAPLMYIGDVTKMICLAEIDVAEIRNISVGSSVRMSSSALSKTLVGHVQSIGRMIGSAQLASPYPTARVDRRSAEVVIAIDAADTLAAAKFVNLQIDVAINASGETEIVPLSETEHSDP